MEKLIVLTSVLLLSISSPISNASNIAYSTPSYDAYTKTVQPYAEVIVTKYRNYHGKLQYRRWNQTLGEWVDSSWIDIG